MLNSIKNLKGVKELNRKELQYIYGGTIRCTGEGENRRCVKCKGPNNIKCIEITQLP